MALYPVSYIPQLRGAQNGEWNAIIDDVSQLQLSDSRVMAFSFTVRKLRHEYGLDNSCFDPRCARCAHEVLLRFTGSETDLVALFAQNLKRIEGRIENRARVERRADKVQVDVGAWTA